MAKAKREPVDETPDEKPAGGGEAAPGVAQPPRPPRADGGLIRLRATRYYKNGMILSPANGFARAEVREGDFIEVTPAVWRQLKADVADAFAVAQ